MIETLILGAYIYVTGVGVTLWKWADAKFEKLLSNHLTHVEERLKALETKTKDL